MRWLTCLFFVFLIFCARKNEARRNHVVEISNMKFTPAELTISKGDTVTWINRDFVDHDVTEQPGNAWSSGTLKKDSEWSRVIDSDVDYFCSIHVVMKGKIRVN